LTETIKQSRLETVPFGHEAKYYKTALHVHGSVRTSDSFACTGASTDRVKNSKTCASDTVLI